MVYYSLLTTEMYLQKRAVSLSPIILRKIMKYYLCYTKGLIASPLELR